ncbi:MAG: SGNH/GDSL hydrolase family protein [Clostridia bacterium]|nr:SGNH/GDSL hydrolase family protein [Clostridia bacterium]
MTEYYENTGEVDKNMIAVPGNADEKGYCWFDVTEAPFALYGFYKGDPDTPFCRLPKEVAEATNSGVAKNRLHTAGGRARFFTDSARIAIRMKMPYLTNYAHMAMTGSASFDLYEDDDHTEYGPTGAGSRFLGAFQPDVKATDGFFSELSLRKAKKRFLTLNFPLYTPVIKLEIGIDAGAVIGEGKEYSPFLPVVFYGSSITQGACASRPGLCYESQISRRLDIDYLNLGFSGSAKGELTIAEYMAGLPMSAFVCDYDHNAESAEYLRETHLRLYRKIREKHPEIPYIMLSRPDVDAKSDYEDTLLRRAVVEDTYRYARDNGDDNAWYIDGEGIFRGVDEDSCTVDGIHPNDLGFLKMADSIGRILRRAMRKGLKTEEK